ncbi:NUDIX hydrolase [Corynebacterium durum]|uniref:NUDIX hydrolase n=1 Tax=Corynebacterium durum TaxID=61592 RepID=UPI0026DAD031|nr:NUDIX domain-containing protein [Corynebacterium durum]MDO4651188.1 NUDIX domain-containing protein [Corynebacterium durum]
MQHHSEYRPPTLAVDLVVFRLHAGVLEVLLMQRRNEPFAGEWALPGGYNAQGETTMEALSRVARTKVGVDIQADLGFVEQLYTFDTTARDPRGHAVSVVYLGCGFGLNDLAEGDNPHEFRSVDELPPLAFDHGEIVRYARERLASKMSYSTAVYGLLPKEFTLSQVQSAYEAVRGRPMDKRNFRKKLLSLGVIHETGGLWREGAHRPAKLYAFNSRTLQEFDAGM